MTKRKKTMQIAKDILDFFPAVFLLVIAGNLAIQAENKHRFRWALEKSKAEGRPVTVKTVAGEKAIVTATAESMKAEAL